MESDELMEDIQGAWVAFVITTLVSIYCFSTMVESISSADVWKTGCFVAGFIIVCAITIVLLVRLIDLKRLARDIPEDTE